MYLDVHAQFWAVEQSCFPRLWFPAVERHYFKQRTYLSFPWVHLRFPSTLFSFYSTFRLCGTGEPWHANKTSLLSLTGTFRAVFSHKFLSSSVWQQQLCTSGFWALSRCLYSSVLYPKLCRSWGWEVHLNAPIMSQLRSLSRQKSGSGSRIFAAAHKPLHAPETAVVRRGWVTAEIRLQEYLKKSSLFSHPFCPYCSAIVLEAQLSQKKGGRTLLIILGDTREVTIIFWAVPWDNIIMQSLDTPYVYFKFQ